MFARLNSITRQLGRPLPISLHQSAFAISRASLDGLKMAQANSSRTINTAACLIIGDEVLGGKVSETRCDRLFYSTSFSFEFFLFRF